MNPPIDTATERAYVQEASQQRRRRLDKRLSDVVWFARREARTEMIQELMARNRSVV